MKPEAATCPKMSPMKKALIAAFISWLCLFTLPDQTSSLTTSAESPAGQTDKKTERHAGASRDSDLKSLYETHQWFKLRDAVRAVKATPFYRGAVAYAFNDFKQAQKYLQDVIKSAPKSEQASEARGLLIYVFQRAGGYRQAMSQIEELLAAESDNTNLKNARSFFAELSQYPEQSVTRRNYSSIRCRTHDGNLFVPLSVDGKSADYILDTGANVSTISESEAKRLGLAIHKSGVKGTVATGAQVGFRTAVANQLTLGNVRLRHVVFLVARDDQQPFVDLPSGERGVLGLPVLLALQTMRWSADGKFESGFRSARSSVRKSNLCFEGADIVTETGFRQSKLDLHLDTGASETVLFPKFAEEFASLVSESGQKNSKRVTGVGDSVEVDAVSLPLLTLRIGGFDATLRPAQVLLKQVGSRWFHGRLGLDILSQARVVTIDFRSMTIALE
jgi:predicted aspartyl protease